VGQVGLEEDDDDQQDGQPALSPEEDILPRTVSVFLEWVSNMSR
jgi:hypothetical protein